MKVINHHVGVSQSVESCDQIRANKSCTAGNQDHDKCASIHLTLCFNTEPLKHRYPNGGPRCAQIDNGECCAGESAGTPSGRGDFVLGFTCFAKLK
jgi:hypothetical protein